MLKWCLNKPEQSKNTSALKELASISTSQTVYRQLRPSYILKIEKLVIETIRVLKKEYLNPFSETIDESLLYNLSSGVPLPYAIASDILKVYSEGTKQMNDFKKRFFQTETYKGTDGEITNKSEDEAGKDQQIGEEDYQGEMTEVQVGEENDERTTNDAGTVTQEESKAAKSKNFHDPIS